MRRKQGARARCDTLERVLAWPWGGRQRQRLLGVCATRAEADFVLENDPNPPVGPPALDSRKLWKAWGWSMDADRIRMGIALEEML